MGIFKKKPELFSVIEHEFTEGHLVEKAQETEINSGSVLNVHEGQQAIMYLNGKALDLFGPGEHFLNTKTLPLLGEYHKFTDKHKTPFPAEIYFVNVTEHVGEPWGYSGKFNYALQQGRINDPPIPIGVRGTMDFHVSDARKFLIKIVGDKSAMTKESTVDSLVNKIASMASQCVVNVGYRLGLRVFQLDSNRSDCAREVLPDLNKKIEGYGITISQFEISHFIIPLESEDYRRVVGQITERAVQGEAAEALRIKAEGIRDAESILNMTHKEMMAFEVANNIAQNSAAGGMAAMGTGLGMMGGMAMGTGSVMAGLASQALAPLAGGNQAQPAPGGIGGAAPGMPRGLELNNTGTPSAPAPAGNDDVQLRFQKLEQMKPYISDTEYQELRTKLINEMMK